ncbi:ATP-binding protein [Isoptericola sp. 178]|uniref:ATP-binding protein n=1 Tax=Isoptericola sp. 178 TaxID=3064651 RepID=UPI00271344FF|nr:ATP-binding protein [Isoptericola sp. 178]MDO8143946.1 ATP-binding protein [Isoptericola sp. 178]
MNTLFDDSPVQIAVRSILDALDDGRPVDESVERQVVDLKEEHGRRDKSGAVGPGLANNELAARELAAAAACMANTPGGGALIVGVSDDGDLIGTELDADWLRHRLWELSSRSLTVDIGVRTCRGTRLLVVLAPQALEPIRVDGRIRWRVGANCVDVDPHTWHAKRMAALHDDWSSDPSTVTADQVRPGAVQQARDMLQASTEPHAAELARQPDLDLLRRLNVVTPDGYLTNAGVIAFVGRGDPCLDYVKREHQGGDSLTRVRRRDRSLLEELGELLAALEANTPAVHVRRGLVIGQQREIPLRAAREAVVNGVAHREWASPEPTLVEQVGRSLRVTSPGGFVGGVTPDNIITHPSRSRNRALSELLAALRVAEREGVGVDRMIGEMIRRGHPRPQIEEIGGPNVRASLIAEEVDEPWVAWLDEVEPIEQSDDVNTLLVLRQLVDRRWTDPLQSSRLIQDTVERASGVLARLSRASVGGRPLVQRLNGVPDSADPVWTLTSAARERLSDLDQELAYTRPIPRRETIARDYVRERGRISSTELGGLVDASPTNVGGTLRILEDEGLVEPAWPSRRGKGFHYVLSAPSRNASR